MIKRPNADEYASFYEPYVKLVPEDDLLGTLGSQLGDMLSLLRSIPEEDSLLRHAPYTWSTRQVVGHMDDAERVFGCRALRFARGDATPLPGFDEGPYVEAADFDRLPLAKLVDGFEASRRSNLALFDGLDEAAWSRGGEASGAWITVRALAAVIIGHARHHTAILRARFEASQVGPLG